MPTSSAVRLVHAPSWEPPYDDEVPASGAAAASTTQGTLALTFVLPQGVPTTPAPPHLRLLPPVPAVPPVPPRPRRVRPPMAFADPTFDSSRLRTERAALPEPAPWAGRLVQAVVEVLSGDRPSAQLVRWTDEHVYASLRAAVRPSALGVTLLEDPVSPATLRVVARPQRALVRSLKVCEPADGIAEVTATVVREERTTAVALRLEGLDGRWLCTALELVGRRP